jgi:U3 small nucleolar RNA-associated protein 14
MGKRKPPPRSKSNSAHQNRALNAFAIASASASITAGGEELGRRKLNLNDGDDGEKDDGENSVDEGSDSEGNEWKMGEVDLEDDSDIDSDEAMGESDEERFEGFTFWGSSSTTDRKKKKLRSGRKVDSNEEDEGGEDDDEDEESEGEDGEGYIGLSEMLDRGTPEDSTDDSGTDGGDVKDRKKRVITESDDQTCGEEDDGSSDFDGSDSFGGFSDEEDGQEEDPIKLEALGSLIASLPNSTDRPSKRARLDDPNEGKVPGEYNLALSSYSKKLTIEDLLPSVVDPTLKKSLKLLADDGKAKSDTKGVPGKLSAPLAKRQQDRIDRAAAYEETKSTLSRWVGTVKHNREADHLHFPLANATNAPIPAPKKLMPLLASGSNRTPLSSFEAKISGILKESNMVSEKQIQEAEQLATNKLSIEDVQRRTAELRMARELMYREEAKAKRIKKIKSKSYRRIRKKERVRQEEAIRDALAEEHGGAPDEDEELEHERRRAQERMSLKHKQSRWAKGVRDSGRGAWDEDARNGAVEMAQRSEDLRRKIQGKVIRSNGESSDEESDGDFDEEGENDRKKILREIGKLEASDNNEKPRSKLMSMKFMQIAESAKKKENDAMIQNLKEDWDAIEQNDSESEREDEANQPSGRMVFNPASFKEEPAPPKFKQAEFEAPSTSDDEDDEDDIRIINSASVACNPGGNNSFSAPKASKNQPQKNHTTTDPADNDQRINPWLSNDPKKNIAPPKAKALVGKKKSKGEKVNHKLSKARKSGLEANDDSTDGDAIVQIDPNMSLKVARVRLSDNEIDDDEEGLIELISAKGKKSDSQRELVKMAFAGDDVVREFKKEKRQVMDEEDDQVIDETLPGWGSWAGSGLTRQQQRQNKRRKLLKTTKGISKDKRKDAKLEKVVVNEKRDKKVPPPSVDYDENMILTRGNSCRQ